MRRPTVRRPTHSPDPPKVVRMPASPIPLVQRMLRLWHIIILRLQSSFLYQPPFTSALRHATPRPDEGSLLAHACSHAQHYNTVRCVRLRPLSLDFLRGTPHGSHGGPLVCWSLWKGGLMGFATYIDIDIWLPQCRTSSEHVDFAVDTESKFAVILCSSLLLCFTARNQAADFLRKCFGCQFNQTRSLIIAISKCFISCFSSEVAPVPGDSLFPSSPSLEGLLHSGQARWRPDLLLCSQVSLSICERGGSWRDDAQTLTAAAVYGFRVAQLCM